MKVLCVFGKYQYGDPSRGLGTEYSSFIPAIKKLGHEVTHFESWDRSLYRDFAGLNRALLDTVEKNRPDVLLAVQTNYEIWLETLEAIRLSGDVATVCWTTDDSWKYKESSRYIGKSYHAMTTTYSSVVPSYIQDGITNILLSQWAANSDFLQEPIPASKCRYPITFIGAAHGDRKKRVEELRSNGLEVHCFGHGWPSGPVRAEKMPEIIRESVISLNFANSKGDNQIKARAFEVPGSGGFMLTEVSPGLEKYYDIGSEIVVFNDMKELVQKARYYLANPEERDRIALAGYERTRRGHTYDLRMKEVLDFALDCRNKWVYNESDRDSVLSVPFKKHRVNSALRLLRSLLLLPCILIWGPKRGRRVSRRILYEFSWRFLGDKTYRASGLPGRLFYNES
ncbi:MAG: glycosyltransferase [Firmicutes bacterium]|nr:glycosyltransferase [Bacillota bacterium]